MGDNDEERNKWIRVRMGVIVSLMVGGLLAVLGRVYYLQTVKREELVDWAREQTSETVELRASRGEILDRTGKELAVTTEVPSLFARPGEIEQPDRAARRLAGHLSVAREELRERLDSGKPFVWLERKTDPATAEAVEELEIRGVGSLPEHKRYYPMGPLAGQLLGFVGVDGNGLEGLERKLNSTLTGETYEVSGMRDARGRTIVSKQLPDLEEMEGNTVELTIDERIQRVTERAVAEQVDAYDAEAGYGVVLEVDSGEILAMATTPRFDPNRFRDFETSDWRLRPVTDTFEPGSIFKPFVLGAALEEGAVSLHSEFECEEGVMEVGDHLIRDTHPMEELTAAQIIQESSNIGAYKVARTIGRERLYEYIRAFGFGSRTGLGIRGEQPGVVRPSEGWADITFANIAFGQGITATPLQVATGMSAIANGGLLLEPRVVSRIERPDGAVERETQPRLVRRVLSEETARRTAKAMSLVTLEEGTGSKAALEDFTVAGKTGTAQKVDPDTGQYAPDEWLGSFIGFAPAERPDVLALVMIDEPQDETYGGVVAAPAVRTILEKSLTVRGTTAVVEDERFDRAAFVEGDSVEKTGTEPPEEGAVVERSGGAIENEHGPPGDDPAEVLAAMPVSGGTSDSEGQRDEQGMGVSVPDLRGLTLRAAVRRAEQRSIRPVVEGWGRVVAQRPRPGSALGPGERMSIVLAPRRSADRSAGEPAQGANRDRSEESK